MSENDVCNFSFRKFNKKNRRKNTQNISSSDEEMNIGSVSKKPRDDKNDLIQSSGRKDVCSTHDFDRTQEGQLFTYKAEDSLLNKGDDGTREYCQDTSFDRDAMAIYKRSMEINESTGNMNDKVYRGMNNYQHFYKKTDSIVGNAGSNHMRHGPMRAPTNIRSTVRWDYALDLCKDYKETGFCGFGDSCKFVHDRTDYKPGWVIDKELDEGKYGETDPTLYEIPSDDQLDPICSLCSGDLNRPVVTRCNHYFCEECALRRSRKTMKCFVCNKDTQGIFNPARDILKRNERGKCCESD